jgi:hypothetical protein
MPVILVGCPPLDTASRQSLAEAFTDTAARVAQASAEKVQVFFEDAGLITINVYAVDNGIAVAEWVDAFGVALLTVTGANQPVEINIHRYAPDHTAKGGTLRTPAPAAAETPTPLTAKVDQ